MKIRAPSFCNLSILEKLVPGHMLSDITVILGSLDFVMGSVIDKMDNSLNLSEQTLSKIDEVVPKYPEKRSAALMVIHLVQDELGAVNDKACEWIAQRWNFNL